MKSQNCCGIGLSIYTLLGISVYRTMECISSDMEDATYLLKIAHCPLIPSILSGLGKFPLLQMRLTDTFCVAIAIE